MKKINLRKNKKIIFICIVIFILVGVMYNERKKNIFDTDIPPTFIVINNEKYEIKRGDANWQLGSPEVNMPGNSYMVNTSKELKENCSFIDIKPDSQINFDISYKNNIQKVTLSSVDITNSSIPKKTEDILDSPYIFKIPTEKGEYYYILSVYWDVNHNVDYLFKIKIL